MRMLYFLAWAIALPFLFIYLTWRARRQPEYLQHWRERLGWAPRRGHKPRLLVHAVSVGETRAATPLIHALRSAYPGHEILLTHTTPTGRETGRALFGDAVVQAYLPYDFPPLLRLFLARARPERCVFMETEIWPAFFATCRQRGIPVYLVNARLSERSARGYRRFHRLVADTLAQLSGIAAQTAQDAARLEALGGKNIQVTGNLKFDVPLRDEGNAVADEFRQRFQGRFVFLAASTRDGEETPLLEAFARHADAESLLLLVPRHPQRFAEVGNMIEASGMPWGRRGDPLSLREDLRVFLGDSMGEMAVYYACADVAYIGGSLLPFGGQNLIEAAASGCPVLIGPHTWNFEEAAEQAVAEGCALRVEDWDALFAAVARLREDTPARLAMAAAGRRFAAENRGATERVMRMIVGAAPGSAQPIPSAAHPAP